MLAFKVFSWPALMFIVPVVSLDEQWSFVSSKACRELLALLIPFSIGMVTSDEWAAMSE